MSYYVGETISETFNTGVAGETFTRSASFINNVSTVWNPTFTDLGGGNYRYSFVTTVPGAHEWIGSGSATGALAINFDVDPTPVAVTFATGGWTYGADFTTQRDRVRRLIPDVNPNNPLLTDTEVALFCTGGMLAQPDDFLAAAMCCETIADSVRVDIAAGGTNVRLSQQFDHWMKRAEHLRDLSAQLGTGAAPYAGGISRADVVSRESDTGRVPPYFSRTTDEWTDPATWGRWR